MKRTKEISSDLRNSFLNFFKNQSHLEIPSSSLIPENDPTLLFTNSGMVQFKNYFIGNDKPPNKNLITIQKCLRAGGKHNDLENVGYTPRHHTFFEMLGNFSFGGYFKENAIDFAWKFLTKELSIDKKKLVITVYKDDQESEILWKKISGFSDEKIIKIDTNDNFWSMGDSGPCGPCSEIFYDNGEKLDGGLPGSKNQDGERFVEIWNLVFMEFEKKNGKLFKLKTNCVDTGMGLERITALITGVSNNFDTDLFQFIFLEIENKLGVKRNHKNIVSFKIIADHIKSICMLMSEGVLPSNEGRGYVLRRLIRRALIQVNKIKPNQLILNKLVACFVNKYSSSYFDLNERASFVQKNLKIEEEKFMETIEVGLTLLNKEIINLGANNFPPETAFKLYDTYGFPIDVTKNILKEKKINLDLKKYDQIVLDVKNKQKNSWKGSGDKIKDPIFLDLKQTLKSTTFLGYEKKSIRAKLLCIIHKDKIVKKIEKNEKDVFLIFDKTPFYAESGGQVGDQGIILSVDGDLVANICDTQKIDGDIFLHRIEKNKILISTHNEFTISIDEERRNIIRNNHSATHLLNSSLREVLGDHISQKGSLVNEEKLRFDFTYSEQITDSQIEKIEQLVNLTIRADLRSNMKFLPAKEAMQSGAIALFGERYPENVRVISFKDERDDNVLSSMELCGGTHVDSTGQIGMFKIISDHSVSSGVKRIEAVTGKEAEILFSSKLKVLDEIKEMLKANDNNVIEKIQNLKKEITLLKKDRKQDDFKFSQSNVMQYPEFSCYFDILDSDQKDLKNLSDKIKQKMDKILIILVAKSDKKISVVVALSKELENDFNAIEVVKKIVIFLGGAGGGGRIDMAQGGAPFSKKIDGLKKFVKDSVLVI